MCPGFPAILTAVIISLFLSFTDGGHDEGHDEGTIRGQNRAPSSCVTLFLCGDVMTGRGIEVYRDKLIIYGAGDFINDYEGISGREEYRGELTLMYFPCIDPSDGSLVSMTMVPMQIRNFRIFKNQKNE